MTLGRLAALAAAALAAGAAAAANRSTVPLPVSQGALAWRNAERGGIRGITVGPIESALHPGKGYGSEACARTMVEARRMGATWVSLTPFGRTLDLAPTGVDVTFEAPFAENQRAVAKAVAQAHAAGLRVLIVPHLWVESGGWRGEMDPGNDDAWKQWAHGYRHFLLEWAKVAEAAKADMLSTGVELRSWVTTTHAPLFSDIVRDVRHVYSGLLTYGANWDDASDTVIWGDLDVIGLNAFFPLSRKNGASFAEQRAGGVEIAEQVREIAESWQKPVLFNEIGYTTRKDAAVEPWIWPERMTKVELDQGAQADAYEALIAPMLDEPWFAGFFVWRVYADPDDMSQEAEWGFSPRGKLAELVVRDAFAAYWETDGPRPPGAGVWTRRATDVGRY
jgi:hypothetical protein